MRRNRKGDNPRQLILPISISPRPPRRPRPPLSPPELKLMEEFLKRHLAPHLTDTPKVEPNSDYFSFRWPKTDAPIGDGQLSSPDWLEIGLLKHLGYTVGTSKGKPRLQRQTILKRVFELNEIPNFAPSEFVAEWGSSSSARRLKKMAYSMAAFCKNAKRKRRSIMTRAVENWEDDLAWLKIQYYDGKFDKEFNWPNI